MFNPKIKVQDRNGKFVSVKAKKSDFGGYYFDLQNIIIPFKTDIPKSVSTCDFNNCEIEGVISFLSEEPITLRIAESKIYNNFKFPEDINSLFLSDTEIPGAVKLPKKVGHLHCKNGIFIDFLQFDKVYNIHVEGCSLTKDVIFPENLNSLFIKKSNLSDGFRFPKGLRNLSLGGCPLPHGIEFPESLRYLQVGKIIITKESPLPRNLSELNLDGGKLGPGVSLPHSLKKLMLAGGQLPEGIILPEGLENFWINAQLGSKVPSSLKIPTGTIVR